MHFIFRIHKYDHALTNYEEFQTLVKLCDTLNLSVGKNIVADDVIDAYIYCLGVVSENDIYQVIKINFLL